MRSGGLGYGSHTSEQGNTVFCEPQQRLQEPKVISNESNRVGSRNFTHILYKFKRVFEVEQNVRVSSLGYVRRKNVLLSGSQCSSELMKCLCAAILMLSRKYTVVGHTVEGQPIYALQSVRTQDRPRLHQGSLYRVMESSAQPRYVFLRQQVGPARRPQRDDINSPNENYRAVAREIVAKALEDKRQKQQFSQESQPSSSGISGTAGKPKKKLVAPDDGESEKISGSTVAAQVAAIQRFSTPLGWKQMGSWLKTAEANEDWSRLKLLLSQCSQANLTLELLQSNDTPKFVRKLSKTCPDQDVRKISGDLVIRWKRLVSAPPQQVPEELKKVGSAKRKTPHPASGGASKAKVKKDNLETTKTAEKEVDGSKQKDISGNKVESSKKSPSIEYPEKLDASSVKAEKSMKASSSKTKVEKAEKLNESAKAVSNKLNEFNMFEKLGEERKEKKRRPKTAKTYTSKFRSTGTVLVKILLHHHSMQQVFGDCTSRATANC
uniref:TFIIS N-terminal domain-containing protein n=1 Tax=Brugia malayi TaxID=6279 RepID=A8NR35_BRUMA